MQVNYEKVVVNNWIMKDKGNSSFEVPLDPTIEAIVRNLRSRGYEMRV